jgi:predicted DNA-binding protein YlxM (UPF0122 family)
MLISDVYKLVVRFVESALSDNTISVYKANQNLSRVKKPFVTVHIRSLQQMGSVNKYEIDDNGIQKLVVNERLTVSLQAFADETCRAEDILRKVHNNLSTQQTYDIFRSQIAYSKTLLEVTSIPDVISATMESRAILDLEFYATDIISSNVGLIETVEIHDNLTQQDFVITR